MGSLLKRIENKGGQNPNQNANAGGGEQRPPAPNPNAQNRPQRPGDNSNAKGGYADLKLRVQNKLLMEFDQSMDTSKKDELRRHIEELFNSILAEESMVLSRNERQRLF